MSWFKKLLGGADMGKVQEAFQNAKSAFDAGRLDRGMEFLSQANTLCRDPRNRSALFGLDDAPSSPGGMAGLADGFAQEGNLIFATTVLDFIVRVERNGKGLSEVWFTLVKLMVDEDNHDAARRFFDRCKESQRELVRARITVSHLRNECMKMAITSHEKRTHGHTIYILDFVLSYGGGPDVQARLRHIIDLIKLEQEGIGHGHPGVYYAQIEKELDEYYLWLK